MAVVDKKVHANAAFARKIICYNDRASPISQAGVKVFSIRPYQGLTFPWVIYGWQIENVQVYCSATAATISADVQIAGVTALTGAITPVAGSIVQGTLVAAVAGRRGRLVDSLDILMTSNGSGTATNLVVAVTIRPFPLDNEAA